MMGGMVGKGKRPRGTNLLAKWIVDQSTGSAPDPDEGKNPAGVALGGLKGRKARASKPTASRRRATAKKAARSRWGLTSLDVAESKGLPL